jgi:hypothetical protein
MSQEIPGFLSFCETPNQQVFNAAISGFVPVMYISDLLKI